MPKILVWDTHKYQEIRIFLSVGFLLQEIREITIGNINQPEQTRREGRLVKERYFNKNTSLKKWLIS